MRLVAFALGLVVTLASSRADAEFVMCLGGQGLTPPTTTVLPPHPRLVYYADQNLGVPRKVTAKIDGAAVAVRRKELVSTPFRMLVLEIDSERTGTLVVVFDQRAPVRFTVKARKMPDKVTGVTARYQGPAHPGERGESFDGLAIRLPAGTPAVMAHVKLRNDPSAAIWSELDVPLYTPESETRPMIRVGQFDCAANVEQAMMTRGFDLRVTVTLADGSIRTVEGLAPHLSLPAPLPPQPRPKNQRPR